MFAEGDVATTQPTPGQMVDIPNLINYYVSQGYNSVDIKEMLPEVPMAVIESAVNALGGSVNPAIASPGADEFSGNINPFVEMQETTTLANQQGDTTINPSFPQPATPPELPSEADISMIPEDIRRYMDATAGLFDDEGMVTAIMMNFDLSEEEARSIVGMSLKPDTDISMVEPSLEKVSLTSQEDGLPEIADIGADTGLGPNEYRTSDGIVHQIDPVKFAESLSSENDRIITGLLLNPNVDYGTNLATIVENIARGRSSTLTPEESIRVGADPSTIVSPGAELNMAAKYGIDFAKEGIEGLYNLVKKPFSDPTFRGILLGRDAEKRAREQGSGQYQDIFPTAIGGPASNMSPEVYASTGGELPSVLDDIVVFSSTGTVEKDLEEIAKEEAKPIEEKATEVTPGETPTKEETPTTDDDSTGTSADPVKAAEPGDDKKDEDKKDADLPQGMTVATENDQAEQLFTTLGNAFNSDANLRMMRNVGKALTQYGNIAEGIGVGTAAASEERKLQEELNAKRDAELAAKLAESGKLEFGDKQDILAKTQEMNENVRDYNNAIAAQELAESVIEFANGNSTIATFGAKIGAGMDDLLAAAGVKTLENVDQLSDTKRAQIALTILTNRNIKEILGESGRTISNIDRDIAKKVVGSLDILKLDNIATLKATLDDNIRSIVEKRNEAQRNIKASVRFLAPYDPNAIDSEILKIYLDELGQQMPAGITVKRPAPGSDSDAIFIDAS